MAWAAGWGTFEIPAPVPTEGAYTIQGVCGTDWVSLIPLSEEPLCPRLPPELFEQLQMLLEPNSITGNDWRRLASHLGLCGMKIR